jgi:hypothetical protein
VLIIIKKILSKAVAVIILTVVSLSLFSCDKLPGSGAQIADTPFSAHMEIDTEKADFVVNVKRLGMGLWEMEVVEPLNIAGLTISYDGQNISTAKDGFTVTQQVDAVADSALFLQVFRTLDNAIAALEPDGKIVDGKYVLSGSIPVSNYEIIFNPETNTPEEIKLPESAITAYISEFRLTE